MIIITILFNLICALGVVVLLACLYSPPRFILEWARKSLNPLSMISYDLLDAERLMRELESSNFHDSIFSGGDKISAQESAVDATSSPRSIVTRIGRWSFSSSSKRVFRQVLYRREGNRRLLVWFHGGAFVFDKFEQAYGLLNELFIRLGDKFDILSFNYPTRFEFTLLESLAHIDRTISKYRDAYDEFHGGGFSAGVLMMGAYMQFAANISAERTSSPPKAALPCPFKKIICVNGMYEPQFGNNQILNTLFEWYIMRGVPARHRWMFTCYGLSAEIPKLIIANTTDLIFEQTKKYIADGSTPLPPHAQLIFDSQNLPHTFPYITTLAEFETVTKTIVKFLTAAVAAAS